MRDQVIAWLSNNVPADRLQHILGVETMSRDLARCHGLDEQKAQSAGLMHDLAKYFQPTRLLQMARADGIEVDPVCQAHPHLLHAEVSAIVARDTFGVEDAEILAAIGNHTLGHPQMDRLSWVVFVADALEPRRGHTPELESMRRVSWENLDRGVRQTCDYSLQVLLKKGRPIHPRTILTRNWALDKARKEEAS